MPTQTNAATGTVADADAVAATLEHLFGLLRRVTAPDGMSLTAASTLRLLELGGARRLTDLATLEGVTQPAMTQLVSRLERDGLARRGHDPGDGRVVLVEITTAGRAMLANRRRARAQRLTQLLVELSPSDQQSIVAALPALERLVDLLPAR